MTRAAPRTIPGVSPALRARLRRVFRAASQVSPRLAARLALELFLTPPRRRLDAIDVPVIARARRYRLTGVTGPIAGLEWRTEQMNDATPAVLLLHGWGSHAARFGSFVDPLLAAGYRVTAFDAPAHGESAGRRSDLPQFRAALRLALDARGPVQAIIAHSLGAAAAVWLLSEEAREEVTALAVIGMPRDIDYMIESFSLVLDLPPEVLGLMRDYIARRSAALAADFSVTRCGPRLRTSTLVVHDEDDDVAPIAHAGEFIASLDTGHSQITQGLNHSGTLRDPATIARIIEFVRARS